ncbi:hypothetical protein [Phaeacidiphilus oryzae]|uniref:hypothetical protein n=1 Tax=Phaeacidiphilus oryzae TaxID=348818 RepID=UPI00068AF6A1|nr:hypothetical protein [Phaeacidiphilus oryzae]
MELSRRRVLLAAAGAGLGLGLAACSSGTGRKGGSAPPPQPRTAPHLAAAEQLVDALSALPWDADRNSYKSVPDDDGRLTEVSWGSDSRVLAQCASFQTLVLQHVYGAGTAYGWATDAYFRQHFFSAEGLRDRSKRYPNAAEFRAGFAAASGAPQFTAVRGPADLRPGDLVAIDYRDPRAWYTGHIAMVRQAKGTLVAPVDRQLGPDAVGHVIEVLDCTDAPHGDPEHGSLDLYEKYPDTRWSYGRRGGRAVDAVPHTGAGRGHMVLYSGSDGAGGGDGGFAGFRWSVNDARAYPVSQRPIAAARVSWSIPVVSQERSPSWDRSLT